MPAQSVPITTNIESSNPVHGEVYSIQQFVILFVSYTCGGSVRCFSLGTPVSSTNKTDRLDITEILLKVALNSINQNNLSIIFPDECQITACMWL